MRRADRSEMTAFLEEAARDVLFPETPALAERVRARIESGPLPVAEVRLPRTRPPVLRPVLAGLAILAVAVAVTLSLSVTARRAVADLLGVVGIEVTFGEEPPASPRPAREIDLGEPTSRAAAGDRAGFDVKVPVAAKGSPAFYFHPHVGGGGVVTVVYPSGAETMADVDLLVTQFRAGPLGDYVKTVIAPGSEVRFVEVRGREGYWIEGEPHYISHDVRDGTVPQGVRLAGNVLLWEEDGVTYRIEGAASLREARRLAASLR